MKVIHYKEVEPEKVEGDEVKGTVYLRWLIDKEKTGASNFAMRMFEVEPGSQAGPHSHSWDHEVFVLEGTGVFTNGDDDFSVGPGNAVYIPGNEPHALNNNGTETIKYLCLISYEK